MKIGWLAVLALTVALRCYDLHESDGTWRGVAFVNEDEWRFEMFDAQGRRTESGAADAFLLVLKRLGLGGTSRSWASVFTPCCGKATRCCPRPSSPSAAASCSPC